MRQEGAREMVGVGLSRDWSGRGASIDIRSLYVGLVVLEKIPKNLMPFDLVGCI